MASEQQESNSFDIIKVPIFCEWIFEKNLPVNSGEPSSLYNHVAGLDGDAGIEAYLAAPKYSIPGFPGIKYYLCIYYYEDILWLYFYVEVNYRKYNFDADFTCTVTGYEPKHFVHNFSNATNNAITIQFELFCCSRNNCCGCSISSNKKLIICVEGIFNVKRVEAFKHFTIAVSEDIDDLADEDTDTKDFVIVARGQDIRVHKSVLTEHSIVFARMFDCENWKETRENKIVIPEFPYEIVKYAVDACYGETYYNYLSTKEELLKIFQFADKYDLEKLTEAVKKVIAFTPHNVVEYANFFYENNAVELVTCCIDYIISCDFRKNFRVCFRPSLIPIKDIEILNAEINGMYVSPVLTKDPKAEHQTFYQAGQKDDYKNM